MQDPLSRIDLNLLVAFQVLMQEKNVTRTAERLFVSQPAMSKTLNRLRNLLDDELFVRSSHGLMPTPKALALEKPVNEVLSQLTELVVSQAEFDPASTAATISVATLGTSASVGMPMFIDRLRTSAPNIMLLSQNIDEKYEERLRSGSLDFAIVAKKSFSDEFVTRREHTGRYAEIICLVRDFVQCAFPEHQFAGLSRDPERNRHADDCL